MQVKFYLGLQRNAAQETAFQIVLRNCSKEVGWEVSEGGVCAIKPMFFLQKVDRGIYSSVIELLLFTRLMAYYQNIFSVFLASILKNKNKPNHQRLEVLLSCSFLSEAPSGQKENCRQMEQSRETGDS